MSFDKSDALRKAEDHSLKGEVSAAITIYRKIVETDPYDFNSINKLGDLYVGAGRIKDAISEFSRIADLHLTGGSATRAAYLLKKTLEFDPSNASVRMKLGEVYSRENMVESAHETFLMAGAAFMRSGDFDKALEANQKALAVKPDSQQAKAAITTLENEAALNDSKRVTDQSNSGGSQPMTTTESASQGAKRKQATGTLDHLLSGYDDDFVVHQISKAEALVGFGEVSKAVAMLKEVLHSAPDNIAIHIKLKDIFLRAEMMNEACVEYKELARIYSARNETARAKDYEVRAQRLNQMITPPVAQPVVQARASAKKVESQPGIPNNDGSNNEKSSEALKASADIHPVIDEIARPVEQAATVARQPSVTKPEVELQTLDALFDNSSKLNLQVNETALVPAIKSEQAMTQVSALVSSSSFSSTSVLGLAVIEAHTEPAVETKSRRRLYASLIIIICLAAIAVSVIKGYSIYEARLNRQYEELTRASSLYARPDLPQIPAFDDEQNLDSDVVTLGPQPTQVVKPSESGDQSEMRDVEPKANTEPGLNAEPRAAPLVINDLPKVDRRQALSPPLVSPALDNNAGAGGNSPKIMSAGVPESPAVTAPAPAMTRKASVPIPGEALKRVQPSYPFSAKAARQGGTVSVEVVINENGDVISARAVSGSDLLRNAAVSAARGWKFKPSMRDGKPVKSTSTITFNFKM
jgi:protein TonB